MPKDLVDLLLPNPLMNHILLLGDLLVLGALGWGMRRILGLLLSVPVAFLGLTWLGMATNDFFLAITIFHLICGVIGVVTLRHHGQRWVAITAGGLLIGTPILGFLT